MNRVKTTVLAVLSALSRAGSALGVCGGLAMAIVLAAGVNIGAFWFSDRAVHHLFRALEMGPDDVLSASTLTK